MTENELKLVDDGIDTIIRAQKFLTESDGNIFKFEKILSSIKEDEKLSIHIGYNNYDFEDFNLAEIKSLKDFIYCMIESKLEETKDHKNRIAEDLYNFFNRAQYKGDNNE